MTTTEKPLHYQEAAERTTIEVWRCVKCKKAWPVSFGEQYARNCCARIVPCLDCGNDTPFKFTSGTRCPVCEGTRSLKRWQALNKTDWDGKTPLCEFDGDKYLFDEDDVASYIDDILLEGGTIDDVRLVLCRRVKPRQFEFCDFFSDDSHESTYWSSPECNALEAKVNSLARRILAHVWYPTNVGVTVSSLPAPPEENK